MANVLLQYGPYNSKADSKREYSAIDIGRMFDGVITDGVFPYIGDCFKIEKTDGLYFTVGSGRAWFNHTWNYLDAPMTFKLNGGNASYGRYDAVVLQIGCSELVRENIIYVKEGIPSENPTPPAMTVEEDSKYEYVLGYIYVPANSYEIDTANIHNLVGDDTDIFYDHNSIAGYAYAVGDNHIGEKIVEIPKDDSAWTESLDEDNNIYYTRVIGNVRGIANDHILSMDAYITGNNVNKASIQISTVASIFRYTLRDNTLTLHSFFKPDTEFALRFVGKGVSNVPNS